MDANTKHSPQFLRPLLDAQPDPKSSQNQSSLTQTIKRSAVVLLIVVFWAMVNYGQLRMLAMPQLVHDIVHNTTPRKSSESDDDFNKRIDTLAASVYTWMAVVRSVCEFLFQPMWGVCADRFGRKQALAASLATLGTSPLLLALASHRTSLTSAWIAAAVAGMTDGVFTHTTALIADHASPGQVSQDMGIFGLGVGVGAFIGPIVWNHLSTRFSMWILFVGMSCVFALLALVSLVFVPKQQPGYDQHLNRPRHDDVTSTHSNWSVLGLLVQDLRIAVRAIVHHPDSRLLALVAFCLSAAVESMFVFFFFFMHYFDKQPRSFSNTFVSWMMSLYGIASAVSQFVLPRLVNRSNKAVQEKWMLLGGLCVATVGFVQLGLCTPRLSDLVITGVVCLAFGVGLSQPIVFGWGSQSPATTSTTNTVTPSAQTGSRHGANMACLRGVCIVAEVCGQKVSSVVFSVATKASDGVGMAGIPWFVSGLLLLVGVGATLALSPPSSAWHASAAMNDQSCSHS